jgi:hypothetical protein
VVNNLPVIDLDMTPEERTAVFDAYRAFAATINKGSSDSRQENAELQYVEPVRSPQGPTLFDLATVERLDLHGG